MRKPKPMTEILSDYEEKPSLVAFQFVQGTQFLLRQVNS